MAFSAARSTPPTPTKRSRITGRSMKGWVLVAPEGVEADDELGGWVQRAAKFVGKLPAK